MLKSFLHVVTNKFEQKLNNADKKIKKADDQAIVNLNFGIADLDENPELKTLYSKYLKNNENLNFDESENLYFIINSSNEKFVFKNFKNSQALIDYLGDLDNNEFLEDISPSVNYYFLNF
jgi:hypothetical protein